MTDRRNFVIRFILMEVIAWDLRNKQYNYSLLSSNSDSWLSELWWAVTKTRETSEEWQQWRWWWVASVSRLRARPHPCHGHGHPHHILVSHRPEPSLVASPLSCPLIGCWASLPPLLHTECPSPGSRHSVADQSPSPGPESGERGERGLSPDTLSRAQHVTPSGHNRGH